MEAALIRILCTRAMDVLEREQRAGRPVVVPDIVRAVVDEYERAVHIAPYKDNLITAMTGRLERRLGRSNSAPPDTTER